MIFLPEFKIESDTKLIRYLSNLLASEIVQVDKPCYYPKLSRHIEDIKKISGITDDVIMKFHRNLSKEYRSWKMLKNKFTILCIILILHYTEEGKTEASKLAFRFMGLRVYENLIHKFFPKFCNKDLWTLTMTQVSVKHIYRVKNGVGASIIYYSDAEFNRIIPKIKDFRKMREDKFIQLIFGIRHKLNQSLRSFSNKYHELYEGGGLEAAKETDKKDTSAQVVADKIAGLICTYKQIDKKALAEAIRDSGVRKDLGVAFVIAISDNKYRDAIKFIITLIARENNLKGVCTPTKRNLILRRIHSDKKIMNKYLIKAEIIKLSKSISVYGLESVHTSQVINLFAVYLLLYMRNRVC